MPSIEDLKRKRAAKRKRRGDLRDKRDRIIKTIGNLSDGIKRLAKRIKEKKENQNNVPGNNGGWHPNATRTQVSGGIGAYANVPAKLVWHTTEGYGLPSYSGSAPHFTLDPKSGKLYQHVPIQSGAFALRNLSGGVETNRAHAIQVELIGFARESHTWSDEAYANIAELARWIEKHAGVARKCSVTFGSSVRHLSPSAWINYSGHLGHQHVPENDHWDPGALKIEKVI